MNKIFLLFIFLFQFVICKSQTINLNQSHVENEIRFAILNGDIEQISPLTQRPIFIGKNGLKFKTKNFNYETYNPIISNFFNKKGEINILPIDIDIEFNSHHPYKRNNGTMIKNKGYQQLTSLGFYLELGPLSVQLKPEHLFAENLNYNGFWDGHYPEIWAKRYNTWNHIDIPERFGEKKISKIFLGQSSIRLNFKGLSVGLSNENLWWGPSIKNSIMMSNNARGFKHLTFNTTSPLNTKIGNFEWQIVAGRLESSGFNPPKSDYQFAGTNLYIPKTNQLGQTNDWRYFNGVTISYSPKWIDGLTMGYIRWAQMYSEALKGNYTWMDGTVGYLPALGNLFRKNDSFEDLEQEIDQAAGMFLKYIIPKDKFEIYFEYHFNDAKQNLRDLILDSDHARGVTLGFQKIINHKKKNVDYLFSWEWTQLEQTASRLLRNAGSWYLHSRVLHGYTNYGEVMGSKIGPGSNSHYFSLSKIHNKKRFTLSMEIIDQDNDFFYYAFESAQDFRRYWKDLNFHFSYDKKIKNTWASINLMYSRSFNYQWELDDNISPWYHNGKDVNNFHANIKIAYEIPIKN